MADENKFSPEVSLKVDILQQRLSELATHIATMEMTISRNDTRLAILEPSVTTAHERLDDLDTRVETQAVWIAKSEGRQGGMREFVTLIAAALAALASVAQYLRH